MPSLFLSPVHAQLPIKELICRILRFSWSGAYNSAEEHADGVHVFAPSRRAAQTPSGHTLAGSHRILLGLGRGEQSAVTRMHTPRSIPAPHNCLLKCLCLQIYGNEELISAAPPLIVLAWTAGCAIFFALPNALMTAELATAFPEPGGQVAWVASAFGRTLGGHNGYWVWLTNILDAAVYPQMAARYLSSSLRMKNDGFAERGVCLGFVVVGCALNLGGLRCVTASQSVAMAVSLTPCLIFAAAGLPRIHVDALAVTAGESDWALLISWAVWLYSGFSSLGSMAGEVENPRRT